MKFLNEATYERWPVPCFRCVSVTDSKVQVNAFYCMLGISLLSYLHAQAGKVSPQITVEQMKAELGEIYEFVLLYPPQGEKGPH